MADIKRYELNGMAPVSHGELNMLCSQIYGGGKGGSSKHSLQYQKQKKWNSWHRKPSVRVYEAGIAGIAGLSSGSNIAHFGIAILLWIFLGIQRVNRY